MYNIELFDKIIEQIESDYDSWDQSIWLCSNERSECGTVGCIAGWALAITNGARDTIDRLWAEFNFDIAGEAIELLGISSSEGNNLFYNNNWTLDDLKQMSKNMTNGKRMFDNFAAYRYYSDGYLLYVD